ncbi:WD40-repeat-containing domain protein [Mycena floridula]|nr:WD40-repeat-containing domain protein [Mycena floridula]
MLAITTTEALAIAEPAVLKRCPSTLPSCLSLLTPVTASDWSPDNSLLLLGSGNSIQKYDSTLNNIRDIHSYSSSVSHLLVKDKASLIFSSEDKVHVLEYNSTVKVTQTFSSHSNPITSLSLSNDSTILASTSSNAAHVHNLTLGSHTVLRALPLAGQTITTSLFHPHSRTRLLLGIGKQIVVYDTTRPSGPVKTIPMNEASSGDIAAIACSPFSKTLVACCTTGGNVGLIDLDKEKGLFRTVNVKVPLTSIAFSAEGAIVYLGTENGKLLVLELRALDKQPKAIVISDNGSRIQTISIQKKVKAGAETTKPVSKASESTTLPPRRLPSSTAISKSQPTKATPPKPTKTGGLSTQKRSASQATSPRTMATTNSKKIFSPVRDPLGNSASGNDLSVQIETLSAMRGGGLKKETKPSPVAKPRTPKTDPVIQSISSRSTRTKSSVESPKEVSARPRTILSSRSRMGSESASGRLTAPSARVRTLSSASQAGSALRSETKQISSDSRPSSSASRAAAPVEVNRASQTPSPEVPGSIHEDEPITPVRNKRQDVKGLGLGTPGVERWVEAARAKDKKKGEKAEAKDKKGKGKSVGFEDQSDDEENKEADNSMVLHVSPHRPTASSTWTTSASPLRQAIPPSPGGTSAHDLLRNIIRDVMFDFQQETRAELTGLHLDLLRTGRGWRKELKEVMNEYVGDLKDLREENKQLRDENEKLRRGF